MVEQLTNNDFINEFQINNLIPICKLTLPEFPTQILTSRARRATHYKKDDKKEPPAYIQKRIDNGEYKYENKGSKKKPKWILCDNGIPIIKNKLSVGKPRYTTLSGNDFMSGLHPGIRSKIVHSLKDYYRKYVKELPVFDPTKQIRVFWKLHTLLSGEWDPSNLFFYYKYFEDTVVEEGKLSNDTHHFVKQPGNAPYVCGVENWEQRKFEFYFYYNG
jgi:hypothetical protein